MSDKNAAPQGCGDSCGCDPRSPQSQKRGFLSSIFKKCAMCAGSSAGGFIVGHAGCIITPLIVAAAGITTATAGMSALALAFSAAVTAGGLYAWQRLRGCRAGKTERAIVFGSAITGLALSAALHFGRGHAGHDMGASGGVLMPPPSKYLCPVPASPDTAKPDTSAAHFKP